MKTVWPTETLGSLCDIQIGRTPPRAQREYWGGEFPWLSISDMNQGRNISSTAERITEAAVRTLNCRPVQPGTVLLSFKLSIGKVGITTAPLYTNEAIAHLPIIDDRLDRDYLYWALQSIPLTEGADRAAMGATLNKAKLQLLPIPMPPIEEQRRIASILDAADALRSKRRQALEKLDTLTQSIFIDMFGDPLTNPKRWQVAPMSDVAIKFSDGPFGSNLKSEHYVLSGIRVVRLQNIGVGRFVDEDRAFISQEHFNIIRKHECLPGDVLVGTLGDPNLRACIQPDWLPVAINKADCVQIRVSPERATSEWLCGLLNCPATEELAQSIVRGQTRARISMGRLRELQVPIPPLPLQMTFASRVRGASALEERCRDAAGSTDSLFASLQHRAFRGEL